MWFLGLFFSIELGFMPITQTFNVIPDEYLFINNESTLYIDLATEITILNYIFVGGSVKTYIQDNNDKYDFFPIQADYLLNAGARYKNIEIGMNHLCIHPVDNKGIDTIGKTYGGYQEFYIRISGEI